jgi:hypothetical protein
VVACRRVERLARRDADHDSRLHGVGGRSTQWSAR